MSDLGESKTYLRGSTLLIAGRMISLLLNFCVQILIVRTLTQSDFGAFAYGLSVIAILTNLNLLGLSKAVGRSLAMYDERREPGALAGVLMTSLGLLVGFGAFIVCAIIFGKEFIDSHIVGESRSTEVLLWLIFLVPLQAIDNVFQNIAAVFVGAKAIFFRKHILGPGLKLLSVVVVIAADGDVLLLSTMYVLATGLGVVLYVKLLWLSLAERGVLHNIRTGNISWPGMALLMLAGPLLATDLLIALETHLAVMVLENTHGTKSVALLRAIAPLVGLVFVISESFKFLYLPLATRLIERGNLAELSAHYWRSFRWIVLLSLPITIALSIFADFIVPLLFGARYAESAILLSVMAPIQFGATSMALNHYTLIAMNRGRFMMLANFASLIFTLAVTLILTPIWGEMGAAIAMSISLLVHYAILFFGLRQSGIRTPAIKDVVLVAQSVLALVLLLLLKFVWGLGPVLLVAAATLAVTTVFALNLKHAELSRTFPELTRVPLLRRLVSKEGSQ